MVPNHGSFEHPVRYYVNVTDTAGNLMSYEVVPREKLLNLQTIAVGTAVSTEAGATILAEKLGIGSSTGTLGSVGGATAGGVAVVGLGAAVWYNYEYTKYGTEPVTNTVKRAVSPSKTIETYTLQNGEEVILSTGFYEEAYAHHRGYGMEYISATTEATEVEIGKTIEEGRKVQISKGVSQFIRVIGPPSPQKIQIVITVGGTVVKVIEKNQSVDDDEQDAEKMQVHFIDVGKGVSILIEGPEGEDMLIDAGSTNKRDYKEKIPNYLKSEGVAHIDKLVLTHPHEDHIKFVSNIIEDSEISIGQVYHNGLKTGSGVETKVFNSLDDANIPMTTINNNDDGEQIAPDGVEVRVLNPPNPPRKKYSPKYSKYYDSNSIVLEVSYEGKSFLLTSDIRNHTEQRISVSKDISVMKASHHGSKSGNTDQFLDSIHPSNVVISSSTTASQPHDETLDRLSKRDMTTYWTGVHGTIVFIVEDGELAPYIESEETTDPSELQKEYAHLGNVDLSQPLGAVA